MVAETRKHALRLTQQALFVTSPGPEPAAGRTLPGDGPTAGALKVDEDGGCFTFAGGEDNGSPPTAAGGGGAFFTGGDLIFPTTNGPFFGGGLHGGVFCLSCALAFALTFVKSGGGAFFSGGGPFDRSQDGGLFVRGPNMASQEGRAAASAQRHPAR